VQQSEVRRVPALASVEAPCVMVGEVSQIVTTNLGRLRRVTGSSSGAEWLLEIPGCGKWEPLSEDQLAGRLSVNHAAVCPCGYHETHEYGAQLVAAMRAANLTGQPMTSDEGPSAPEGGEE
jgi:hypothetical protein